MERYIDSAIVPLAHKTEGAFPRYIEATELELVKVAVSTHGGASERLARAQAFAATQAARTAAALTTDRWLWLMRRLSPLVYGAAPQRLHVVDWYFTETTAALFSAPGVMAVTGDCIVRQRTINVLMKFLAFALWDSLLRSRKRCERLGVGLDDDALPKPIESDPTFAALGLLDKRLQQEAVPFGRWGTLLGALSSSDATFTVRQFFRSLEPEWMSVARVGRTLDPCEVFSLFYTHVIDVSRLREALVDEFPNRAFASDALHLIMLLKTIEMITCMGRGPAEELLTTGVCYVERALFEFAAESAIHVTAAWAPDACATCRTATTANELEAALRQMRRRIQLDPLRAGPVFYDTSGDNLALNAATASQELSAVLEFPNISGGVANRRAAAFEVELQHLIDSSFKRPPENLRRIVRRNLRLNGKTITDVDAMALNGRTLVLISCKSLPFRALHDSGDPRSVFNSAKQILRASEEWDDRVTILNTHPVGDNYDLSGYELLGIVCTPLAMFVPIGKLTEFVVPSLRRYVSASELAAWLHRDSAEGRP